MPLHLLAEMAEAKCKGTLFAGFVLLPLIDQAQAQVNALQHEIAAGILGRPKHAHRVILLGELGWTLWWYQIIKQCLMKLVMAEAGLGSNYFVELMSLPAGDLQGRQ